MANATSILINVGSRTAGAQDGLNKVTKGLRDQDKASQSWSRNMLKASNLAKAGFAAAGVAAIGAAASMIDFAKAAIDDQKEAQNLANSLKSIPGVTDKMVEANASWIDSMELATNVADTDLRNSMSRLALVTQDVGKAQELTALAADVSVGRNISLAAATKIVEKAATGHTEALMRQMPWLDKNKDGILTTNEAIKGLGTAYEDAAKKAADNDPWTRLKTVWGQLKEALGQWVLPLLKEFGDWFKDPANQQKVKDMIDKVAKFSYELGVKVVQAIKDFIKWLKSPEGQKAMQDFRDLATDIGNAIKFIVDMFNKAKVLKWAFDYNPLRLMLDWLNKIKGAIQWIIDHLPGVSKSNAGGGGGSWLSVSSMSTTTAAPSSRTVVVNMYGGTLDAMEARRIKRLLELDDVRQGRDRGAPLAVAW